jgi:hypothetical protein
LADCSSFAAGSLKSPRPGRLRSALVSLPYLQLTHNGIFLMLFHIKGFS